MPTLLCLKIIFLHLILPPSPLRASFPVQAGEVVMQKRKMFWAGWWYWRGPRGAATPVPGFAAACTVGALVLALQHCVGQPLELRVGCRQPAGPLLPEAASYQDRAVLRVGQAD